MTLIAIVEMRFSLPELGGEGHIPLWVGELHICRSGACAEHIGCKPIRSLLRTSDHAKPADLYTAPLKDLA
jgi:hypothetical protein